MGNPPTGGLFVSEAASWNRDILINMILKSLPPLSLRVCFAVSVRGLYSVVLFFVHVNDLFNSSNLLSFILFTDYTNIFFRHETIFYVLDIINRELRPIPSWFKTNKLNLQPEIYFFHPPHKVSYLMIFETMLMALNIRTDNTNFVGIYSNPSKPFLETSYSISPCVLQLYLELLHLYYLRTNLIRTVKLKSPEK